MTYTLKIYCKFCKKDVFTSVAGFLKTGIINCTICRKIIASPCDLDKILKQKKLICSKCKKVIEGYPFALDKSKYYHNNCLRNPS